MVDGIASAKNRKIPEKRRPRQLAHSAASVVMEEARRAGLLDGDSTEHISFRAPKFLIKAAKRESGVTNSTELGLLALAMLALPDPVANYMTNKYGKLEADHQLDY